MMSAKTRLNLFYQENRQPIHFLLRAGLIYLVWTIAYHGFLLAMGINDPLTKAVAVISFKFSSLFDNNITLKFIQNLNYIYFQDKPLICIGHECNGLELYVLFVAFYLALNKFIASWKWILLGIFGIFVLNIGRIAALAWVVLKIPHQLDFHHKYTFALVVYSWIFLIWFLSARRFSKG
jgi:exosortase/archaeosortase family protein